MFETLFRRVEVYMKMLLTSEMMDMTVKVMVEVPSIGGDCDKGNQIRDE